MGAVVYPLSIHRGRCVSALTCVDQVVCLPFISVGAILMMSGFKKKRKTQALHSTQTLMQGVL